MFLVVFPAIPPQILREPAPLLVAWDLESIARILVFAAGTPIMGTPILRRRSRPSPRERVRTFLILRLPETSAGEPLHDRVGMADLQLPQRRQQLVLEVGAKGGRLAVEDDRPVVVPGRHVTADYGSFVIAPCGGCGSRRFSFSMSVVRFKLSSLAAWRLLPCVRSSDRRISDSSTPSI